MRVKEAFDAHDAQLAGLLACNTGTVCPNHESSIKRAFRDAMLAVHVDACEVAGRTARGKGWLRRECGDGWGCGKAKRIKELGGNDGQG